MGLLSKGAIGAPAAAPGAVVESSRARLRRFMGLGVVAQVLVALGAHVSDGALTVSGTLGTAIPFVLGLWYGATVPDAKKDAVTGGLLIGVVGAVVGVAVAILLGDQTWMHLTFAPVASGITGLLGGATGTGYGGGVEPTPSSPSDPPHRGVDAP